MERTWNIDTTQKTGETVKLNGWAKTVRRMGDKLVFIDLRDGTGVVQCVVYKPDMDEAMAAVADDVKPEYVLEIEGEVKARGEKQINNDMPTGTVEVGVTKLIVLNASETPPFEVDQDTSSVNEELRMQYRYLDLRSDRMQQNLRLRDKMYEAIRSGMRAENFVEIETPFLTKGTPEGAREFIVPARQHGGQFYVLPQSPQQFKQLLMVSGFERYFQIVRCFRDEDQRGDRQPEFTQLDVEMSFVSEENDVINLIEKMVVEVVKKVAPEKKIKEAPFPRMTYKEAMEKYDTDRPDLRENKEDNDELAFLWVNEFPMYEYSETDKKPVAVHHPFTAPMDEDREKAMEGDMSARAKAYDLVLNGFEIAGGSIRIHEQDLQEAVFKALGLSDEEVEKKFGHMLKAFSYGAPPHGGIAFGFDRFVAILAGEPNIREVIAFPKTGDARDPLMGAPSELPKESLLDVHISSIADK